MVERCCFLANVEILGESYGFRNKAKVVFCGLEFVLLAHLSLFINFDNQILIKTALQILPAGRLTATKGFSNSI